MGPRPPEEEWCAGVRAKSTVSQGPPAKPCPPPHPRVASRAAAAAASPKPARRRRCTGVGAGVSWPGPGLRGEGGLKRSRVRDTPTPTPPRPSARPEPTQPAGTRLTRDAQLQADGRLGPNTRDGHSYPNDAPRGLLLTSLHPGFPRLPTAQQDLGFALLPRWGGGLRLRGACHRWGN